MIGQSIFKLIPEALHQAEHLMLEQIRRGERVNFSDTERISKDGRHLYIALSVSPIWDASGMVIGASSIKRDITERKQEQEELVRREKRYRALVTAAASIVWTADGEGRFAEPQASWEAYTGQSWSQHAGFGWIDALHSEDREAFRAAWAHACRDRSLLEVHGRVWNATSQAYRHFTARAAHIVAPDGVLHEWIGMLTDVEVRWVTEERLRQAERMEMIGRLAGGVAHEANNQMTVVLGATEFVLRRVHDEVAIEDLEHIRNAARRTATITQQLLAFSRRQVLQPQLVDLNAVVTMLRSILERALGEASRVQLDLAADLGKVMADPGQLEQVLLNLALNARDAMPGGGALTIETGNAFPGEGELAGKSAVTGPHAMIAVHDTGEGMDRETLKHVFEPFFTTKEVGRGSGLGLATVHGIVEQSGGFVTVGSERGRGTTFRIYLPLVGRPGPDMPPEPAAADIGGAESILVVEDDASVRAILARTLSANGYDVHQAGDGAEALALICRMAGGIDLVIAEW